MSTHKTVSSVKGYLDGCRCEPCTTAHATVEDALARYMAGEIRIADLAAEWGITGTSVRNRLNLLIPDGTAGRAKRPRLEVCTQDGCDLQPRSRGLCAKHYTRLRIHGDPGTVMEHPTTRLDMPPVRPVDAPPPDGISTRQWTYSWRKLVDFCRETPGQWYEVLDGANPGSTHRLSTHFGLEAAWRGGRFFVRAP